MEQATKVLCACVFFFNSTQMFIFKLWIQRMLTRVKPCCSGDITSNNLSAVPSATKGFMQLFNMCSSTAQTFTLICEIGVACLVSL